MRVSRWLRLAAGVSALAVAGAACGGGDGDAGGGDRLGGLTGTITGDGSSTVFPITQAVAEEFYAEAPNVKVSVGVSGTGGGFKKFCAGETDLQDASRPIKDGEKQECASKGVEYVELQVAMDGLSVLVHPKNSFVACLTVDELKKVWGPEAQGKITRWSQVRAGFPNTPLKLYGPGTDSGTFDYFTEEIVGKSGKSRSDYVASEDDNVLVKGISGDQGALGYFGYAYYQENKSKLKALGVDGGSGCVQPTEETINTGSYKPLSRPLYIYVAKKATERKEFVAFMDFYLETVHDLVADVGYIPVPKDVADRETEEWATFKGGA